MHFFVRLVPPALITFILPVLLCGCGTPSQFSTRHEPVNDAVLRKLDKQALDEEAFATALQQKGIDRVRTPPANEVRWRFQMVNGVPIVYCRINDRKSIPMIFDTGASHSMLNASDVLKLRVMTLDSATSVPMIGVMGTENARLGVLENLEIGKWKVKGYPCLVRTHQNGVQSSSVSRLYQPNILGFDLAVESASFLTVDYPRGEIIYGFGEPFALPVGPRTSKCPIKLESGVATTRMSIGSHYWDTLIDTGSFNGVEINRDLAQRLGVLEKSKPVEGLAVYGVGGTMSAAEAGMRVTTVPQLQACGLLHHNAEVDIAPGPPRLGSYFLKDYRVTFDFRRKLLWLEW